ncbi:Autism susceptibility protein 2 protein [Mactra antiquata]
MENEPKARTIHRKRRERAQKLQPEISDSEGDNDGEEQSPLRGVKDRSRSKPRKKNRSGTYEEDIIDGFAIVSFKSIDDLEKFTQGKLTNKAGGDKCTPRRNHSISPARHKHRIPIVKKHKTSTTFPKSKKHNNSAADSESSGETTDHLDTSNLILNGPKKTVSRRYSDVSTRSSSGAGYLCDSESGDERVSDTSLDIFQPVSHVLNHSITCEKTTLPNLPPVSTHNSTITTATHTTTTTGSDVTVTIVTAATTCTSLVSNSVTTTSIHVSATHHAHTVAASSCTQQHNHLNHQSSFSVNSGHTIVTASENKYLSQYNQPQKVPLPSCNDKIVNNNNSSNNNNINNIINNTNCASTNRDLSYTNSVKSNYPSVIKRRPTSPPPLTKSSSRPSSPPRPKPVPPPPHSVSKISSSVLSSPATSNSVINREPRRPTPPSRSRTPRREDSKEREVYQTLPPSLGVSKSFFSPGFPGHGSPAGSLYSPLGPSPGLHSLHSTPSHTPTFPGTSIPSIHPVVPPVAPPTGQTTMFVPPIPLGIPTGPGSINTSTHLQPESPLSISNPDLLREELNRRFLASQDRSSLLGSMPPLLRADIHQHMHQHQHQHMHQHTYHGGMPPPPVSASPLVPTPTQSPFDKVPSNPFFRQGLTPRPGIAEPAPRLLSASKDKPVIPQHPRSSAIPGLPGYPSPLPDTLHSGLPGAFQPKGLSGLHPAVGPLFIQGRELDKSSSHIPQPTQSNLPTTAKKPGRWCAVHVRIAWEIYHHQQKQNADKSSDHKPPDPLRPPSHLIQGGTMSSRPPELPVSASSSSMLGSGRGLFESNPHNILGSSSLLGKSAPSFPRPSAYSIGSSLPLGLGNGLPSTSRDPLPSLPSSSQDWGRLHHHHHHHRTTPTFPASWSSKNDEREKEIDREIERKREEERERERRLIEQERHRYPPSLDDRSRDRDRFRENEMLVKSRSRSRSPMRNSRSESVKSERSYDKRPDDSSGMKVKEERREDDLMNERLLKNDYLANSLRTADAFMQAGLMDRTRMLTPTAAFSAVAAAERVPPHPSLWNPFDKGPVDIPNMRLNLQREMEQARDQLLLNRFPGPSLPPSFPGLSPFEQDRIREEMILREKRERDYLERLPIFARERMLYESKIPGLRPPEHLHASLGNNYSRNVSPALHNHLKRSSPSMLPGAPPPLIHSASAQSSRGHGSPAVNKTKGVSPTDSVGESKRDSNSNSTDPDAHSR